MTELSLEAQGTTGRGRSGALPLGVGVVVLFAQFYALHYLYRPDNFIFECRAMASPVFCSLLSSGVMRAAAVIGAAALFLLARPSSLAPLRAGHRPGWAWAAAQVAGFGLILSPLTFLTDGAGSGAFALAVALWLTGLLAAGLGTLFFFVRPADWARAVQIAGPGLWVILALAFFLPDVAPLIRDVVQHIWNIGPVTHATFVSATFVLELLGEDGLHGSGRSLHRRERVRGRRRPAVLGCRRASC